MKSFNIQEIPGDFYLCHTQALAQLIQIINSIKFTYVRNLETKIFQIKTQGGIR